MTQFNSSHSRNNIPSLLLCLWTTMLLLSLWYLFFDGKPCFNRKRKLFKGEIWGEGIAFHHWNTVETPYKPVSNTSKYGAAILSTLFLTAPLQLGYQSNVKLLAWLKTLFQQEKKAVLTVKSDKYHRKWKMKEIIIMICIFSSGHEIAPNTGTNVTKFFTLATKSWKLIAKLATSMFHHNLTERYSELKRFAKINPWQTSLLGLFPKRSTCLSIDN